MQPEIDLLQTDDTEVVPAYPPRASQVLESMSDHEMLMDIRERLDVMERYVAIAGEAMKQIGEQVKQEGLVGVMRMIPEMMRIASEMKNRG